MPTKTKTKVKAKKAIRKAAPKRSRRQAPATVSAPTVERPKPSALETSTLRPGLLVSLKTSVTGNIQYIKRVIEHKHIDKQGKQKAKWETLRIITDPEEMERAWKAQQNAYSAISSVCARSAFGLLCPEADAAQLEAAIVEARRIAEVFNKTARLTKVKVYTITGRVASNDVEAIRAINSELRELLDDMQNGVDGLDAPAIRKAADKAKRVAAVLTSDASARVKTAIDAGRAIARKIVKAGETTAAEIDVTLVRQITDARTAFLDLDAGTEVVAATEEVGRQLEIPMEELPSVPLNPIEKALGGRVEPRGPGETKEGREAREGRAS